MKKIALAGLAFFAPALAFAQARISNINDAGNFIIATVNNVLVPVLLTVAFITFIWGIFQSFILNGGDPEKREGGQKLMIYGIVGFFLMVSVWGLVNILVGTFNFNQNVPYIPTTPGIR